MSSQSRAVGRGGHASSGGRGGFARPQQLPCKYRQFPDQNVQNANIHRNTFMEHLQSFGTVGGSGFSNQRSPTYVPFSQVLVVQNQMYRQPNVMPNGEPLPVVVSQGLSGQQLPYVYQQGVNGQQLPFVAPQGP